MEDASELELVRSRLVSAGLAERRRIERALHDGVQQDLIALSVELQLARGLVAADSDEALASLDRLQQEVRAALARLQALAGEIYPAILDARGLPDALRQAARASGAAASVETVELGRYPTGFETAVYFLCRAVLDTLEPGAEARIRVREEDGELRVSIEAAGAVALEAVSDVVEAAGGIVSVTPGPAGTRVEARFALA